MASDGWVRRSTDGAYLGVGAWFGGLAVARLRGISGGVHAWSQARQRHDSLPNRSYVWSVIGDRQWGHGGVGILDVSDDK